MAADPDGLVLAVDQGTGSSKAVIVDPTGRVVASGAAALDSAYPRPGWVEQDPLAVVASVRDAVSAALQGIEPARVRAVGFSTQRESALVWERATGRPLAPLLGWQDRRTADRCARLVADGAEPTIRERTGLPVDPMFSAVKLGWLLDEVDPDRTRSARGELCVGTVDSWLLAAFGGGAHLVEAGNASRTQLLRIADGVWDPELLDLYGVPADVLPEVVPSTGPFPGIRDLPGIPDGTPVGAVLGDSHAALFAHAGWRAGTVKSTYGTGSSVMGTSDRSDTASERLCRTVAWATASGPTFAVEGNIRSTGATLTWLARLFDTTPARLADLAATAEREDVYLVPAFTGLGAPYWDTEATATLVGMSFGTGLPQLARAALESIAFQVEDVVAAVDEEVGPVAVLAADGGASANPLLMQLQADLGGRVVRRSGDDNLSALGAAHLAGHTVGLWDDDTLLALPRPTTETAPGLPDEERHRLRAGWADAVRRARSANT